MTRKKLPIIQHKTLTVAEVGVKLPELRQQMIELLSVAEKVGGEHLRDMTECIMGFDDQVDVISLMLDNFERRLEKLRRHMENSK